MTVRGGIRDVAMPRPDLILATSGTGSLYLFHIDRFSPLRLFLLARFQTPLLHNGMDITLFNVVASPSAYRVHTGLPGVPSFFGSERAAEHGILAPVIRHSRERGIIVLTLSTAHITRRIPEPVYSTVFLISDFLELVADPLFWVSPLHSALGVGVHLVACPGGMRFFPSDMWANFAFRVQRNLRVTDFTLNVVGTRTLQICNVVDPLVFGANGPVMTDDNSRARDVLVLTEYSPDVLPAVDLTSPPDECGASSTWGMGEWTRVADKRISVRTVRQRSILAVNDGEQQVFAEDVLSTLPYRQVVTDPMHSLTFSVLDENRVWLQTVSQSTFSNRYTRANISLHLSVGPTGVVGYLGGEVHAELRKGCGGEYAWRVCVLVGLYACYIALCLTYVLRSIHVYPSAGCPYLCYGVFVDATLLNEKSRERV